MSDTNYLGINYSVGATFIGNTATHTGRWGAIHFTTNTQIDAITAQNYDGTALAGQSFNASTTLYGVFTSIKLQNGHCVAYKL
jgi:predicted outer membrane repeat protein